MAQKKSQKKSTPPSAKKSRGVPTRPKKKTSRREGEIRSAPSHSHSIAPLMRPSRDAADGETAAEPSVDTVISYIPEIIDHEVAAEQPRPRAAAKGNLPALTASKSLAVADPLAAYLREIRKYPLLTADQERDIAVKYAETGDAQFAEILVTSNLRFVVKIAAEYARVGARMIDLVQEGNMGLLHAVKIYNPYKGVRLITYAVWWIRGYIQEYLMKQYSMVKIGTTQSQRKLFYQLQREREMLEQLGETGDYKALAQSLGVSEGDVQMMTQRLTGRDVSLNVTPEEGGTSLLEMQADSTQESVDDRIARQEELELLRKSLANLEDELSEREKFLLENRLLADQPLTLQEIGDKYGITREAARQMEARLIGKLQKGYQRLAQPSETTE